MAGFDQTGPTGQGAMTGKKMGKCTNFGSKNQQKATDDVQENTQLTGRGVGRGLGCGRRGQGMGQGQGMGRGNRRSN